MHRWLIVVVLPLVLLASGCTTPQRPSQPDPPTGIPDAAAQREGQAEEPAPFPSPLILSVLYFEDRAARLELGWLRKGLADMLVAELARRPNLIVVQRERLDEVLREQSLQLTGRVSDATTVGIGRLLGATVLLTGSLSVIQDSLRLEAQLVTVERGIVVGTATADGPVDEAPKVAAQLVQKIVRLLPIADRVVAQEPAVAADYLEAAKATAAAETLSREGRLWEALREYERALAAAPGYGQARANYGRVLKELSGSQLLQIEAHDLTPPSDQLRLRRLAERLLASGMEVVIGTPRPLVSHAEAITLKMPVTLRMSWSAINAVVEAARAMGGRVEMTATEEGSIDIILSSQAELNRAFVEEIRQPRRLYLRLLGRGGVTLGIYSQLQEWRLSEWVLAIDDQTVRLKSERTLATNALFVGLTQNQLAAVSAVHLTIDPVTNERASVRLDVREPLSRAAPDESAIPSGDAAKPEKPPPLDGGDTASVEASLSAIRSHVENLWSPAVSERPWSRGYLPGNERRAVVGMELTLGLAVTSTRPRIIRSSGDPLFDRAALVAARDGIARWLAEAPPGDGREPQPRPSRLGTPPHPELRLRFQFQLIKDIPTLNLIGAQAGVTPIHTLTP